MFFHHKKLNIKHTCNIKTESPKINVNKFSPGFMTCHKSKSFRIYDMFLFQSDYDII